MMMMICQPAMKAAVVMIGRVLTPDEEQWLRENYDKLPKVRIAKELDLGIKALRHIAKELGIWEAPKPKAIFEARPMKSKYDKGKGYCIDCRHYRAGGVCAMTSKSTGALHRMECFKDKNDEYTTD